MSFNAQLDEFITTIGCTHKELSAASGIGMGTISRYRTGIQVPEGKNEIIGKFAKGLAAIAAQKGISLSEEEIYNALNSTVESGAYIDYDVYIANLRLLLGVLEIKGKTLAEKLSYDPSHISRILSGQRRPSDTRKFSNDVVNYIVFSYGDEQHLPAIAATLGCDIGDIDTDKKLLKIINQWLGSNAQAEKKDPIKDFLSEVDTFNLDEYIQVIHFNDIKLPSVPFQLPTSRNYYGIKEMMDSELDFMKATVLSKSTKDVIIYSDMPLEEMASDPEFPKKYMFGMAMMLKKGLHINFIHDVNRPFHEMMLGLEANIPMYMTGQISPYYLKHSQSGTFLHLLKVSGAAALEGSAIAGHHTSGRYVLSKSKEEVRFYRRKAEQLLERALPLMDIYRSDRRQEFFSDLKKLWKSGNRRMVFGGLPLFTISQELLEKILARNKVNDADRASVLKFRAEYCSVVKKYLAENKMTVEIPKISQNNVAENPPRLGLSELFYEKDILYSAEEYALHLAETKDFAANYSGLMLKENTEPSFKNITFSVIEDKCVIVSKDKFPAVHFVIHHPKMVKAFQGFIPPIKDE